MQHQFRVIGDLGMLGHHVLSLATLAQETGQENVTTRPQLMVDKSVRESGLRLRFVTLTPVQVYFRSELSILP